MAHHSKPSTRRLMLRIETGRPTMGISVVLE
jgi:hypothetical protein